MLSRERFISYGIILLLGSALIYFVLIGDEEYVEDFSGSLEAAIDFFEDTIS